MAFLDLEQHKGNPGKPLQSDTRTTAGRLWSRDNIDSRNASQNGPGSAQEVLAKRHLDEDGEDEDEEGKEDGVGRRVAS